MTIAQVLLADFDAEMSNTRRTLERVPEGAEAWVPHERSMALGKLAMHCARMPLFGFYVLEDEGMDLMAATRPHPSLVFTTREACLEAFDEALAQCRAALEAATDEQLEATWKFCAGEYVILAESRVATFRRMCFNHMIHHVAQLGVYLRLNEIAVPPLYGPSADEQWESR